MRSINIWDLINCEWIKCITLKWTNTKFWEHTSHKYMRLDNWKTFFEKDFIMQRYKKFAF